MSQRYVIWVAFDGSRFSGFAKSGGNGFGAMDLLDGLLKHVLEKKGFSGICASPGSRTDAGVHVIRGPVMVHTASSKYLMDESPEARNEILTEANQVLKKMNYDSLKLLDIHRVSKGFSLRKNVSYRRYIYRLRVANSQEIYENCRKWPSISCFTERFHSWSLSPDFDFHRANEACTMLQGRHNMASFFKFPVRQQLESYDNFKLRRTERTLDLIRVIPGEEICDIPDPLFTYYNFEIVSRSFMREQVRRLLRVVVDYSRNRIQKDRIKHLFDYPHPNTFNGCGLTAAPSHGLYLVDCVYDPDMYLNPVPCSEHSWDWSPEERRNLDPVEKI